MFWNLLLAHFIGDFLLQTDWMVKNRGKFWVLILHSGTHFVLMLFLIGGIRSELWPYLVLIALVHMVQDAMKNFQLRKKPDWSIQAFVIDQGLHYLVLWIVSTIFLPSSGFTDLDQSANLVIFGIAYLFVTYVWFVSERIFFHSNPEYVLRIKETKYTRMLTRAGFMSIFLLVQRWVLPSLGMVLPGSKTPLKYRQRELSIDLAVSIFGMVYLFWAVK